MSEMADLIIDTYGQEDGPLWDESEVGIPKDRHGHILCQYCGNRPKLIHDSTEVYGVNHGKLWICRECRAWVGCRPFRGIKPLGRLANADLRKAKMAAHASFDPMWKAKARRDRMPYSWARDAGYAWLAEQMELTRKQCHIGHFDLAPCEFVIALCQPYHRRHSGQAKLSRLLTRR